MLTGNTNNGKHPTHIILGKTDLLQILGWVVVARIHNDGVTFINYVYGGVHYGGFITCAKALLYRCRSHYCRSFSECCPSLTCGGGHVFAQPVDDKWNGWDKLAIEYLKQQEEIAERYNEEYTFRCTRLYYGYEQGEPMYASDGTQLPTDVAVTIVVYKGSVISAIIRDDYKVNFLRNEDGTYRVDNYEAKNMMGSLVWNS